MISRHPTLGTHAASTCQQWAGFATDRLKGGMLNPRLFNSWPTTDALANFYDITALPGAYVSLVGPNDFAQKIGTFEANKLHLHIRYICNSLHVIGFANHLSYGFRARSRSFQQLI